MERLFSLKMNVAKSLYIFIILAIVHCDKTTNGSTTKTGLKNSTISGVAKTNSSNGLPINLRAQIDVPPKNDTTVKNATTKSDNLLKRRRAVLIINTSALRTGIGGKRQKQHAQNLLYEEYNDDGSLQLSYPMKSLDDVARFFEMYLNTKICLNHCDEKKKK